MVNIVTFPVPEGSKKDIKIYIQNAIEKVIQKKLDNWDNSEFLTKQMIHDLEINFISVNDPNGNQVQVGYVYIYDQLLTAYYCENRPTKSDFGLKRRLTRRLDDFKPEEREKKSTTVQLEVPGLASPDDFDVLAIIQKYRDMSNSQKPESEE